MNEEQQENAATFKVVVNHEGQYSLWPAQRDNPLAGPTPGRLARRRNAWLLSRRSGRT